MGHLAGTETSKQNLARQRKLSSHQFSAPIPSFTFRDHAQNPDVSVTRERDLQNVAGKIFVLDDRIEAVMDVFGIDRVIVRLLFRRAEG